MAIRMLPDREYVRECLDYDPETGVFRWKERPDAHFQNTRDGIAWNAKWTGRIAGCFSQGYRLISISGVRFKAHRVAWLMVHGEPVPSILDHIDGDPSNNRINNIRAASQSENLANAAMRSDNHSGIKGIFKKTNGRYMANIRHNGRTRHLGVFDTIEQAVAVRREAAESIYGQFARHR